MVADVITPLDMLFLNTALLAGLLAIAIPIILHLLNRRTAKVLDWGAMRFLLDSLQARKKRIQLEEALLMACRCLVVALVPLAVARPFIPPGSQVPWVIVLPCFLLGVAMAAVTSVMWGEVRLRKRLLGITVALFALALGSVLLEKWLNLSRFGSKGQRDIALIIDGSTSMTLKSGSTTSFDLALKEAEKIVAEAGTGTAFSLILGGPVPQVRIPEPMVNRNNVREELGTLRPVAGKMAAFETLFQAVKTLAAGRNPSKQIIVLTDAQDIGWELDKLGRWESLAQGVAQLGGPKPELVIRQFPLPPSVRNAAVSHVSFSRDVIGTDRPVGIEVAVTNTGSEAITPASVDLSIDGKALTDSSLGQLLPGATETVRFQYQFTRSGTSILKASIAVDDDILVDNEWSTVAEVKSAMKVLIIDGASGATFAEKASSFAALALAPGARLKSLIQPENEPQKAGRDLIDPEVKGLHELATLESFAQWDAVILCDAPALSGSVARVLGGYVEAGGGLLVATGGRAQPDFYNQWRTLAGQRMMPLPLIEMRTIKEEEDATRLSLQTLSHGALRLVADAKQSDLESALFRRYWRLADQPAAGTKDASGTGGAAIGGRFGSGDPFLAVAPVGRGMVVQMATALDTTGSNLASRHAFVPLMHMLTYFLASPDGQRLNRAATPTVAVALSRSRASGGLQAEYFGEGTGSTPVVTRVDPQVKFDWREEEPVAGVGRDRFRVRWTGTIVPRFSEDYTFQFDADDEGTVLINGEAVAGHRRKRERLALSAGQPAVIEVTLADTNGPSSARLYWQSPSQRREIVPTSALRPYQKVEETDAEISLGDLEAVGPDQLPRTLELIYSQSGMSARLKEKIVPGLYQISIPAFRQPEFKQLLTAEGKLPFSVVPDAAEGNIKPLDEKAFAFLERYFPVLRPKSKDDVMAILAGKQFGEELWKYLAVGALFLLLCEIALSRWIALQRQSEAGEAIVFEDRGKIKPAFAQALEKLQG